MVVVGQISFPIGSSDFAESPPNSSSSLKAYVLYPSFSGMKQIYATENDVGCPLQ
jgi:hypothetical protein